jgi:hypothetical protein
MAAPVISSVTPNYGPPAGGTAVNIAGTGLTGATSVRFAGQPATNVVVVSDTSITCITPAATEDGPASVAVTTPGGTGASSPTAFTYTGATGSTDVFPAFVPIVPPPPIGAARTIPTFPPPTPPPIGTVPVGPLVGPAIAPAGVPPSLAGVTQPQFKTGSATAPASSGYWPQFTTTTAYAGFPNNPPAGVPIVFSNISTNPSLAGGVWTVVTPPSTATTAQITLNGMSILVPHDVEPISVGDETVTERLAGAILSRRNPDQLHQSQSTSHRRSKRMPTRHSSGRADRP